MVRAWPFLSLRLAKRAEPLLCPGGLAKRQPWQLHRGLRLRNRTGASPRRIRFRGRVRRDAVGLVVGHPVPYVRVRGRGRGRRDAVGVVVRKALLQ